MQATISKVKAVLKMKNKMELPPFKNVLMNFIFWIGIAILTIVCAAVGKSLISYFHLDNFCQHFLLIMLNPWTHTLRVKV